jgi:hypothetical protein
MEMIASFGAFAMIMLAMAVGVIVSGKTLKGSCGGTGSSCACADQGTPNACQTEDSTQNTNAPTHSSGHTPLNRNAHQEIDDEEEEI